MRSCTAGSWLPVPGPGELGREVGGTRHSAIRARWALSFPSTQAPWDRMDPASAHTLGSLALLEPCTAPRHQLRGSPQESTGLSILLALANAITLCRLCALGPAFLPALPLSILLGFFGCPRHCVCVMLQGEEACESPMTRSAETGTAPVLRLGTGAAARQEWDRSSQEWWWKGMRVVCGLTAAFPAKGSV